MSLQDCITFANEHPVCFLATMDGDQPRVRTMLMWYADPTGFYFVGIAPKAVEHQLKANPKIELCFYNNPVELPNAKQMRVTGKIEFVDDPEINAKAYENRSWLEPITGVSVKPLLEVFRVRSGEVFFWTIPDMLDMLKEPQIERIHF
jgi:pyridoxamine 5'-phosphate oxidase